MFSNSIKVGLVAAGALALGACAGSIPDRAPAGTDFDRALYEEYSQLAEYERRVEWDFESADYYGRQALAASEGQTPLPIEPAQRDLTPYWMEQVVPARQSLLAALDGNARANMPNEAARAQAKLECWMEQAEENFQWDHIRQCKEGFQAAMAVITAEEPQPAPQPEPVAEVLGPWTVYFDFDRSNIRADARPEINAAWEAADAAEGSQVVITGHTDTVGSQEYNLRLSERRAQAVQQVFEDFGLDSARISVNAVGQAQPAVETGDEVREPLNRRAVIRLVE